MSLIKEDSVNNSFNCLIDCGILKDDICALAAKF